MRWIQFLRPTILHHRVKNMTLAGNGERLTYKAVAVAPSKPPVRQRQHRYIRPTIPRRRMGVVLADYTSSDEDAREDAVKGGGNVAASVTEEEGKVAASKMGGCKVAASLTREENALCKNAAASVNEEKGAGKVTTGEQQKDAPSFT